MRFLLTVASLLSMCVYRERERVREGRREGRREGEKREGEWFCLFSSPTHLSFPPPSPHRGEKGQTLVTQGAPQYNLWFVASGSVDLVVTGRVIANRGVGFVFGESGFLSYFLLGDRHTVCLFFSFSFFFFFSFFFLFFSSFSSFFLFSVCLSRALSPSLFLFSQFPSKGKSKLGCKSHRKIRNFNVRWS
jgi:hypothetical protein